MRGHHYDTPDERGIALLLAKPCTSERAYVQALGRVGRYGKPCKRYTIKGIAKWDDAEQAAAISNVIHAAAEKAKSKARKAAKTNQ